jgi:hypothetical protein
MFSAPSPPPGTPALSGLEIALASRQAKYGEEARVKAELEALNEKFMADPDSITGAEASRILQVKMEIKHGKADCNCLAGPFAPHRQGCPHY